MRIFAAVVSWVFWFSGLYCVLAAALVAFNGQPNKEFLAEGLAMEQMRSRSLILVILSFLVGVGAFLVRRYVYFYKFRLGLEEIGGVFFWLCLTGFICSLAFGAAAPGSMMVLAGESRTWGLVSCALGAFLILLGTPLLPPQKGSEEGAIR